ncbi:G-protein coupled receptor 54-like [Ptychodera flava]|uniref:G-protein coupled receptor 54-like n=1 Tax=Ptychodera flava TaxID=63121 RepID=UPI003969C1BA
MEYTGNVTGTAVNYDYRDPVAAAVVGVLTVVGMFGNALVVYIVARYRDMHNITNIYVSNLAKTDICFLVCCAVPAALQLADGGVWTLGDFMCRFAVYMQSVTVQATCGTLTIMTMDRCFVIFNPLKARMLRTKRKVWITIVVIWIISFAMHTPVVMFYGAAFDPYSNTSVCTYFFDEQRDMNIYTVYEALVMYAIPLIIIIACNVAIAVKICTMEMPAKLRKTAGKVGGGAPELDGRAMSKPAQESASQKVRVTVIVFIIVIFFAICWGPVHATRIFMIVKQQYNNLLLFKLSKISLCLTYLNSALNPVLYAFLGKNYRAHAKHVFCCANYSQNNSSYSQISTTRKRISTTVM